MNKHFCIESFFLISPMRSNNAHMKSMVSNSLYEINAVTAVGRTKLEKTSLQTKKQKPLV